MNAAGMRRSAANDSEDAVAIDRVRQWARERFDLPRDAAIMVAQLACTLPGCPPVETVIAFWSEERRHHFKVFKPVADIAPDDLPPSWMKRALAVPDDFECECC
jgi:nitrate reductase delta subunit